MIGYSAGLDKVIRLGLSFDLILLSAVWMHIPPADRTRAFRKLVTLLKPGGRWQSPCDMVRWNLSVGFTLCRRQKSKALARAHGAFLERATDSKDELGRGAVTWTQLSIRLPDDGTGALPLLRHIILNDDKSSTYKLALLRALCRIADGAAGYARDLDDGHVAVPLGLVGLYWIRLFKPLLAAGFPQNPMNQGEEAWLRKRWLSKAKRRFASGFTNWHDLQRDRSNAIHSALRDACDTITRMPAQYMTYPGGGSVLLVKRIGRVLRRKKFI